MKKGISLFLLLLLCVTISAGASNLTGEGTFSRFGESVDFPPPPQERGVVQFTTPTYTSSTVSFKAIASGQVDNSHTMRISASARYYVDDVKAIITAAISPDITNITTNDTNQHTYHLVNNLKPTGNASVSSDKKKASFSVTQVSELYTDGAAFVPLQRATVTLNFSKTV